MIRDHKIGIIPLLNIHLGNSKSKRIKEWYKMLNEKHPIFGRYASGTMGLAIIDLNKFNSFTDYENSVRGKDYVTVKCTRCLNRGYTFNVLDRNKYSEEIFSINTSADTRQGKKMKKQYLTAVKDYEQEELTEYYGVFNKEGKLVSYIHLLFTNEAVFIFKLLGHDDYLKDNIMYLMIFKAIEQIFKRREEENYQNLKYIVYDSFFTNSEGLTFFKKRFGFSPNAVKWSID